MRWLTLSLTVILLDGAASAAPPDIRIPRKLWPVNGSKVVIPEGARLDPRDPTRVQIPRNPRTKAGRSDRVYLLRTRPHVGWTRRIVSRARGQGYRVSERVVGVPRTRGWLDPRRYYQWYRAVELAPGREQDFQLRSSRRPAGEACRRRTTRR
jgi:hypothetical protein